MSRHESALNEAAAARPSVGIFVACDLDLAGGHLRAHDGIGTISWGGNDYSGVGKFGGIEVADESIDLIAHAVKLSISGVDPDLIEEALGEVQQGRSATLYLGLYDNASGLIDTPEILWEGFIDQPIVRLGDKSGVIAVSCEHRLRREPRIARYTHEDQQLHYAGDRFFDLVPKIAGYLGKWGASTLSNYENLGSGNMSGNVGGLLGRIVMRRRP